MPIDFTRLSGGSAADSAIEPRRIFAALPSKDPKYNYARDVQSQVWDQWHERRNERDLIVKMNTGGGKTVVGLLMLKSCLNEGKGPAVYLAPDRYLTEQVKEEASLLGLEVTDDPYSGRFQRGKAILLVNIKTLVNGLSRFGTAESGTAIEVGSLLVDDAHAGVAYLREQFTLKIPQAHAAYVGILEEFEDELKRRSANSFRDILENEWNATLEIPFWSWIDHHDRILSLLHPHRQEQGLKFVWPLIKDCLALCRVAVTSREIEITPPCPPINQIPSLVNAPRRIYLTATLADDSILVTHFGANANTVARPITPATADDLGDRMILTPLDTHPLATGVDIVNFVAEHAQHRNVVVIVPSWRHAQRWRPHAAAVLDKDSIQDGVAQLRQGHVGLVVLVNKYDGIDLPGDACHLLVLEDLPEVYSGLERLDALALGENDTMSTRQVQRIEQGMGRGVRSTNDYCVVLLLGAKLTQRLNNRKTFQQFSAATRAQLSLSEQVADQLHGRPFTEFADVVDQCLSRDRGWVTASRSVLDNIRYDGDRPAASLAQAQREAFDYAAVRQFHKAADTLYAAAGLIGQDEPRLRAWIMQQVAAYRHFDDPIAAQKILTTALELNPHVLKPRDGVKYTRLTPHSHQATAAASFLQETYKTAEQMMLGFNAILDDLQPHPETTEQFEQGWADLGRHLGFASERPERERGNGPDVLWALGELKYLVTECKSGTTTAPGIARHDVEQLSHSVDWFVGQYDATCAPLALLIHKRSTLNHDASARLGSRVMTFDHLSKLRSDIRTFATAAANNRSYTNADFLKAQLVAHSLTAGTFLAKWSTTPKPK